MEGDSTMMSAVGCRTAGLRTHDFRRKESGKVTKSTVGIHTPVCGLLGEPNIYVLTDD